MKNACHIPVGTIVLAMVLGGCSGKDKDIPDEFGMKGPRQEILFDQEWKFLCSNATGAEDPVYDDAAWHRVDLPHDWSIVDIPGTESPLDPLAPGGISTGYFTGGTGWYRNTFDLPSDLEGKRISILFEGVYMDATVWVNGSEVGNHPYGYTSFWYDITDLLTFGDSNSIAVRVRNEGRNSRWYSGSGIYRHVWLYVTQPVHIPIWGTSVTTP
ncbi:MAG: hypothetical protein EHM46_06400, partial [Bacteroidetes bacterium]